MFYTFTILTQCGSCGCGCSADCKGGCGCKHGECTSCGHGSAEHCDACK